jgi:hypothetical protein
MLMASVRAALAKNGSAHRKSTGMTSNATNLANVRVWHGLKKALLTL